MPTLFTDPRSGGVKKRSGVNVLPIVKETWEQVRSNKDPTTYLLATYTPNSKLDVHVLQKGTGGIETCCKLMFHDDVRGLNIPLFGGVRLASGRFVSFMHCGEGVGVMAKGRASMHKNGVLNVLEGCDMEIEVWEGMEEKDVGTSKDEAMVVANKSAYADPVPPNEREESTSLNAIREIRNPIATNSDIIPRITKPPAEQYKDEKNNITDTDESKENNPISDGTFPYSKLKEMTDPGQFGVDPAKKELALSDVEFFELFQMDKASFGKLPGWKQTRAKKSLSLF